MDENIEDAFERLNPSDISSALQPDRPFDGRAHTVTGEHGQARLQAPRIRDVRDCFIIGAFRASGIPENDWPDSVYDLPWDEMDPIAVAQNMELELGRRCGTVQRFGDVEFRTFG